MDWKGIDPPVGDQSKFVLGCFFLWWGENAKIWGPKTAFVPVLRCYERCLPFPLLELPEAELLSINILQSFGHVKFVYLIELHDPDIEMQSRRHQ